MGAGASAERKTLVEKLPKCHDYTMLYTELDSGDGIDIPGLEEGLKGLGFKYEKEEIADIFRRFKTDIADQPKLVAKAKIKEDEFFQFLLVETTACEAESGVNLDKYTHMHELLGPVEAAHGFPTAHALLKHKPDIARELWFPPDTQAGDELFTPRPATVNGWTPLHMVLVAGGNSNIVRQEAPALIKALLEAFPESASMRIQPELGLVEGHLPLYLAIQYGWDIDTVKSIIAAYPDAPMTVDVIMKNKGKNPNIKKDLFARKIAEDCEADPEILAILPKPAKAKPKEMDLPNVRNGCKWEMVEEEPGK